MKVLYPEVINTRINARTEQKKTSLERERLYLDLVKDILKNPIIESLAWTFIVSYFHNLNTQRIKDQTGLDLTGIEAVAEWGVGMGVIAAQQLGPEGIKALSAAIAAGGRHILNGAVSTGISGELIA